MGRIYDDKDVQERIVRSSKLDWVIVRPVILTNGQKTSAYRVWSIPARFTKQIDDDLLHKTPVLRS